LLEFAARSPSKANLISQGSLRGSAPSLTENSPIEDRARGCNTTLQGVTTPEDVSLSNEGDTGEQPTVKHPFPVKHFSTRDLRKRRSESFSSEESAGDAYEPPQRASADRGSIPAPQQPPAISLSAYGHFFFR
jgi:hypothetical protein